MEDPGLPGTRPHNQADNTRAVRFVRIKTENMRVRKADDNQPMLVRQMRNIPGLTVAHTHTVGNGFVDVVCGHKGLNYLFEIKDPAKPPSKRKLTPDEVAFHNNWTGSIHIIETIDDVLKIIKP
jgi:hypothetical protein